jgi:hypothetical protein
VFDLDPDGEPRPLLDPNARDVERVMLALLAAKEHHDEGATTALLAQREIDWPEVAWALAEQHAGLIADLRAAGHHVPPLAAFLDRYRAALDEEEILAGLQQQLD